MSHIEHHHARYGSTGHIVYHEHAEPAPARSVRDLVRPWTIRQWIAGGKMYREASPREVPRFELFFDLLYVAVIHQLAEAAIEEPGWPAVLRFILTFWPSWSVWDEARKYANVSGTDDLLHRTWILVGMITILGYSASTSAISLQASGIVQGKDLQGVRWAAGFWLAIKLTRVLVLFLYAYQLPLFRTSQLLAGIAVLVPMLVYAPLLWVTDRHTQIALACAGIVLDLSRVDYIVINLYGRFGRWRRRERTTTGLGEGEGQGERQGLLSMPRLKDDLRLPALNIEHAIERSSAFVVIVLGELVMNLLYKANEAETGLSVKFGKACMGLMIAWGLNYSYLLPDEPNAEYEHALRRSWLTGSLFTFLHFPLVACLILASAACGELMQSDSSPDPGLPGHSGYEPGKDVHKGVEAYWMAGLGGAILCITTIDLLHKNLSKGQRIPRTARTGFGLALGGLLLIDPLQHIHFPQHQRSVVLLALGVVVTWVLVGVGIVGSLPAPGVQLGVNGGGGREGEEEEEDRVGAL